MFTVRERAMGCRAATSAARGLTMAARGFAIVVLGLLPRSLPAAEADQAKPADARPIADAGGLEQATFGGGCFWCTEAVFERVKGVRSVASGYSGGAVRNPTYQQVTSGATGHAEVIQLTFDPKQIAYKDLLEIFWRTHDPTTLNQQGPDIGTQYRSVIFYHNPEQKRLAEYYKQRLDEAKLYSAPVVTEISPFREFYRAEAYHQDYYERNRRQRYCQAIIRPKLEKFKKLFEDKMKTESEASPKTRKTDAEWRSQLTPAEFAITRKKGTEAPFTGKYWNHKEQGAYRCVCCGAMLFQSTSKFDSECGWPSFSSPAEAAGIDEAVDRSHGMVRTEVKCSRCDAHLGHVFNDGPTPTGLRYCINSASLRFEGKDKGPQGEGKPSGK